jgi:DNA processing protein
MPDSSLSDASLSDASGSGSRLDRASGAQGRIPAPALPPAPEGGVLEPGAAARGARELLRAWLALQDRAALRPEQARRALEATGNPAAALRRLERVGPRAVLDDPALDARLAALARMGVHLVPFGAEAYPERLATLADAPPLLGVRGRVGCLAGPLVALVGARRATRYGRDVAARLARELAAAGVGVISGLAHGVDAAAHRGALAAGGPTAAVLGCGPDVVYPADHAALAEAVVAAGAVVSELPPGALPLRYHFPLRNRLISALAEAVVVVEARARSGSLITAEHAAEQGRDVLAVPGPIDAPASEGPNRLLRDGAAPVLDAGDVLRAIGRTAVPPPPRARADPLEAGVRVLLAALREEPATRDELGARLGLTPAELSRRLVALELAGRVAEDRDGRLRFVAP